MVDWALNTKNKQPDWALNTKNKQPDWALNTKNKQPDWALNTKNKQPMGLLFLLLTLILHLQKRHIIVIVG